MLAKHAREITVRRPSCGVFPPVFFASRVESDGDVTTETTVEVVCDTPEVVEDDSDDGLSNRTVVVLLIGKHAILFSVFSKLFLFFLLEYFFRSNNDVVFV